jgi:integrase
MSVLEEQSIKAWLNEFSRHSTQLQYSSRIKKFFDDTKKTPKDIQEMDLKEAKALVLEYQADQHKKGLSNNGILGMVTAIRSYLISIDKVLTFRRGQLLNLEADNSSHVFTNGDLRRLFEVGNTYEKALLASAVSQGWEISAFLDQDREIIKKRIAHAKQNNQNFIFFTNTRQKTGVARFCVLNPLAIEWLGKYLETRKDHSERLFPITQDGVQKMLHRLAEQSGLKTTGNIRFHNIRKWLMSRLSRCGFNEFQIKYLMGKSIGVADSTYLQTLQIEIEEKYPLVYEDYLNIFRMVSSEEVKKIQNIEQELQSLKQQNFLFKTTLQLIARKLNVSTEELEHDLEEETERHQGEG